MYYLSPKATKMAKPVIGFGGVGKISHVVVQLTRPAHKLVRFGELGVWGSKAPPEKSVIFHNSSTSQHFDFQ